MTSEPIEDLDPLFLEALTKRLHGLPDIQTRTERHQSWMTAEQIARWWSDAHGVYYPPEAIDALLRARWLEDPASSDIRPAKYPDRTTVCRLWGHVARVAKYENNATEFLFMLTGGPAQVCVYPRRPAGWAGRAAIGDFEDIVRERLGP